MENLVKNDKANFTITNLTKQLRLKLLMEMCKSIGMMPRDFDIMESDLNAMNTMDLTQLTDDEVNAFLDAHAKLNNQTPTPHGYDYIIRGTGMGEMNIILILLFMIDIFLIKKKGIDMQLYKHTFNIYRSDRWRVTILIEANIDSISNYNRDDYISVSDSLWAGYDKDPSLQYDSIVKNELKYLWQGLNYVHEHIVKNSKHKNGTLITVRSVQFSLCDFQEDALPAAMMEWTAKAFGFEMPVVEIVAGKNPDVHKYDFKYDGLKFS